MNNAFRVRARTLDVAMKRARDVFGADAVVLGTENVVRKLPDSLSVEPLVELVVQPVRPVTADRLRVREGADYEIVRPAPTPGERARRLRDDVERIERLIASVEHASLRLGSLDADYPLLDALLTAGVSADALRVLQARFEREAPGQGEAAAREHLRGLLRGSGARDFASIRGAHVFLGAAGCGRTSMLVRVATEMVRAGRRPVIVAAAPYHRGEVRRIEEVASTLMIDAVVVRTTDELQRALKLHADADAVLVDTPCVLSRARGEAGELLAHLRESEIYFKHFVLSMTDDIDVLLGLLDLHRRWRCDFVALSRIDLARRCGKIVDIAVHHPVTFSFLSWAGDGAGIVLADTSLLAGMVSPAIAGSDAPAEAATPDAVNASSKAHRRRERAAGAVEVRA